MTIYAESVVPMDAILAEGNDYIEYLKEGLSRRMAEGVLDILSHEPSIAIIKQDLTFRHDVGRNEAYYRASLEWKPLVKCKECKHRGHCPYMICPPDDFFCADGEKENTDE